MIASLPDALVEPIVRAALAEDLGRAGDITSEACIPEDARLTATFGVRKAGVVSGLSCARLAIHALDPDARFDIEAADGQTLQPGTVIARVEANARALLSAERVALNLMGRMSGVASLTALYVSEIAGTRARIIDTRKTTPGLRALEKAAVRAGGGANHRGNLSDWILLKDNHLSVLGIPEAVRLAKERWPARTVHVECDSLDQVAQALDAGADALLLDNMTPDEVRRAVELADDHGGPRPLLEVSGGVTGETVGAYARTGADCISVGAITNSAPVLDIGLDIEVAP